MQPNMPIDQLQALVALRDALLAAPRKEGVREQLIKDFAKEKDWSPNTVYRNLKERVGYITGRKRRSDSGKTKLPEETLLFIASSISQSVRRNGISTKPICVAMNIADQNGMTVNVSSSRIAALMRASLLDGKSQAKARNHQRLRSEHPNHVHQIDPSLCLVYYLNGRQTIMSEEEFNKNKPVAMNKVKWKVWRYVRFDHGSRSIDVRYYEAAGENQQNLFEFLIWTWGKQPNRLSHGVPRMLTWDKGSRFSSPGVRRLCDALGVMHEAHATHHAWVKGGVENSNWIVETQFESRLRDEPVETAEQLNASSEAWVRDYNANAIKHVDARVHCDDGERRGRDDLWNLIAHFPGALVEMPSREACAYFMRGKEETRKVNNNYITFVHPQTKKSELYRLNGWEDHYNNGMVVTVSPLLMGDASVRVTFDRIGKDPVHADVSPEREFDEFGRPMSATLIGTERKISPHNAAQQASKRIAAATYGEGTSLDEAEKLKAKNARPFMHLNEGRGVVAHTHLGKTDLPQRLLPAASTEAVDELAAARGQVAARLLTLFEAGQWLTGHGVAMNAEAYAKLRAWHPDGVLETDLDALSKRLTVRAGLRVVAGGGA